MTMTKLSCHDCRKFIPAYVSRELPTSLRRRVGEHLDGCEACYTVYLRQREIAHELVQQVPAIGRTNAPQLGKIWNAVQTEMTLSRPSSWSRVTKRHGIVTIALVLVLLLPSLGYQALQQRAVMALPVPPTPTEAVDTTSQAVAMATAECNCVVSAAATAAPNYTVPAHPNYAPNASGTETP
jgi:anti-sigma factor RsiW